MANTKVPNRLFKTAVATTLTVPTRSGSAVSVSASNATITVVARSGNVSVGVS